MRKLVAGFLLSGLTLCAPTTVAQAATGGAVLQAATAPKTALMFGDSLTRESAGQIAAGFVGHTTWTGVTHSWGGTSPCDWLTWLPTDLTKYHPSVVGIETVGNHISACMVDANGNALVKDTPAYLAKYRADLNTFFAQVTATGAKLLFVQAPPMLDPVWNSAITHINAIALDLASQYHGVSITKGPRNAVSASGVFKFYKPCYADETAAMGCAGGRIAIRTLTGSQIGIHLCPAGLSSQSGCATYSSGERRFGKAIAHSLMNPPAPVLP